VSVIGSLFDFGFVDLGSFLVFFCFLFFICLILSGGLDLDFFLRVFLCFDFG